MEWLMIVVLVLIQYCGFVFGETCFIDDTNRYEDCDTGCCGRSYENNRRCCNDTDVLVWIIVGSVIGGILLISFIVAVVCCVMKSKGRKGMVVSPTYTTNQTTTVYQVPVNPSAPLYPYQTTYMGPPAYMANPPPYSQFGPPQQQPSGQTYTQSHPAPYPQQQQQQQQQQSMPASHFNQQPPNTQPSQPTSETVEPAFPPPPATY